jgi:hypothetical protein
MGSSFVIIGEERFLSGTLLRSSRHHIHLPPTTNIIQTTQFLATLFALTDKPRYSRRCVHLAVHAVTSWYQLPTPAHQRPYPPWTIGRPTLPILLGKMISQAPSTTSWHNSQRSVTNWIFKVLRLLGMHSSLREQKVRRRLTLPLHLSTVQRPVSRPLELAMAGHGGG